MTARHWMWALTVAHFVFPALLHKDIPAECSTAKVLEASTLQDRRLRVNQIFNIVRNALAVDGNVTMMRRLHWDEYLETTAKDCYNHKECSSQGLMISFSPNQANLTSLKNLWEELKNVSTNDKESHCLQPFHVRIGCWMNYDFSEKKTRMLCFCHPTIPKTEKTFWSWENPFNFSACQFCPEGSSCGSATTPCGTQAPSKLCDSSQDGLNGGSRLVVPLLLRLLVPPFVLK